MEPAAPIKRDVLFVCGRNRACSQMAEAFLNRVSNGMAEAQSAGLEPSKLDPLAVEVMREIGLDISRNQTRWVYDFLQSSRFFSYVITVCDDADAERCPVFFGGTVRLHWSFPETEPSQGSIEERLADMRRLRDAIRARVESWWAELLAEASGC